MKTPSDFVKPLVAALAAAALASGAAAATALEAFKAHEAEIATNRCVAVGGYVFGVGRALSNGGGDIVGFSKARLLAFGKIADRAFAMAPWPETAADGSSSRSLRGRAWRLLEAERGFALTLAGCETILERREAPDHYMAVIAIPVDRFVKALPSTAALVRCIELAKASGTEDSAAVPETPQSHDKAELEEYEPRGYWEESGVKANETLAEGQFL